MRLKGLILFSFIIIPNLTKSEDDLYKLLGVPRDATVKEIRKAFKNLAVKLHPDKNKDDDAADEKFIKIAEAYEILKDPESRKTYDIHGTTDSSKANKGQYQSYSYYQNEFGIYDDDPLIVTLSKADYELNVLDDNQAWFINFYSPHCHHCHTLAPTWRRLAAELEGVVRIAAVNCEDDWVLCHQLNINAYPTLLFYEKEAHLYEGELYRDPKDLQSLKNYIISRLNIEETIITPASWNEEGFKNEDWLLFLCAEGNVLCPEEETRLKLTAALEGLLPTGTITNSKLCDEIYVENRENTVVLWRMDENGVAKATPINGSDMKEIIDKILDSLPNPELLDEKEFKKIREELRAGTSNPWLICFYLGTATELNLQLKRLPTMIVNINIALIHCGRSSALCGSLHVSHYPAWGVLKDGGAFELHHGRDVLHEVAAFARDSTKSTNLHALSPADFQNIKNEGEIWFIDWYAPWCPPCRKLMPEIRKASQHFNPEEVRFGTVDCTLHKNLCAEEGVRSYPTTVFYNGTNYKQHFHGVLNEDGIVEFVDDMLHPSVISLNNDNFNILTQKPEDEMWLVDFYAPWCGPCQRLAPQWRSLAKQVKTFSNVKIAQVDCVENYEICSSQKVQGYPTIRMFPLGSKGMNTVILYNGHRDALSLKAWIINFLPTIVKELNSKEFTNKILKRTSNLPWLVDFYAPWCGHCVNFEPNFRIAAEHLKNVVHSAKFDCDAEREFCRTLRVTGYPTVILYLSGNSWYPISSQDPNEIIEKVEAIIESQSHYSHDEL